MVLLNDERERDKDGPLIVLHAIMCNSIVLTRVQWFRQRLINRIGTIKIFLWASNNQSPFCILLSAATKNPNWDGPGSITYKSVSRIEYMYYVKIQNEPNQGPLTHNTRNLLLQQRFS